MNFYDIDINQEMLAQGTANVTSGLFQGINVAGSLSKSSINDASSARSEMASLAQGVFVILTLLFLAPLFADLPQAVLGAIVIEAVLFGRMDVKAMQRIYRLNRIEFWVGTIALLGGAHLRHIAGCDHRPPSVPAGADCPVVQTRYPLAWQMARHRGLSSPGSKP